MRGRVAERDDPRAPPGTSGLRRAAAVVPFAVVLAVDPGGLAPFGPAKWAVAGAATLALAAVIARGRPLCVARLPTGLFVALVGWTGATAALGLDPLYAWIGTPERRLGVVAWVLFLLAFVSGQALRPPERRAVTTTAAAAVGLAGLWAVAELLGWRPFDVAGGSGRPGGPFGSSAYLGAFAVLAAPAAAAAAVDPNRRPAWRVAAGIATGSGVTALVASGARAAWVAAVVAGSAWLVLRRRPGWPPRAAATVTVAAATVAVATVVALASATGVAGRVPELATDDRGGVRGRIDEWRTAVRVVAGHPVVGVGSEGYRIAFGEAVDADYERAHGRSPLPDRAHSAVLDVATAHGVPGAAAYLALLALVGAFLLRAIRDAEVHIAAVAAGVLAYFVQSLFLFPVPELDVPAWLLAGVVVGAVMRDEALRRVRVPRLVPVTLALLAAGALAVGGLDVTADRAARRALAGRVDAERAARLRPDALRYRLVAARAYEETGTAEGLRAAVGQLHSARRLSPRDPVVGAELGRLLLEQARRTSAPDDVRRARAHLEAVVRGDRHNAEAQLRLGLARALDGDDAGAESAWLVAEDLAPRSAAASTNLAVAYARTGRPLQARAAALRALERDPASVRARDVLQVIDGT